MWNLKYDTNELIYETDPDREQTCGRQGSGVWRGRSGSSGLVDANYCVENG